MTMYILHNCCMCCVALEVSDKEWFNLITSSLNQELSGKLQSLFVEAEQRRQAMGNYCIFLICTCMLPYWIMTNTHTYRLVHDPTHIYSTVYIVAMIIPFAIHPPTLQYTSICKSSFYNTLCLF